jgi:putative sigma-54 modulation protein
MKMDLQFDITGRHFEITDALRKHAQDRVSKFPHYYNSINHVEVVIEGSQGHLPMVEIIARGEHNKVFVAKETGADVYACMDLATHKIERQLTKMKAKERDNKYGGGKKVMPESVEES